MTIKIEEAFNDCFERLSSGESLDSCLRSYPEHAMELDFMLRTAFDVKRRVYPIQPRPEFKYWSRVRLQGVQDYMSRHAVPEKAGPFSFRKNLAISVAGLLVLVIASSGTAAASNDALPDQPLYGVKMAVEQAQLSIAASDLDKAELYASLAAKRAHEIEAMARQGKSDYLATASARMDYQLGQAETYISKYQTANTINPPASTEGNPDETSASGTTDQPVQPAATQIAPPSTTPDNKTVDLPAWAPATGETDQPVQTPAFITSDEKPTFIASDNKSGIAQAPVKRPLPITRAAANVNKAKTNLNSSTAKSLATLQDALNKAPESDKPAILKAIERVKKTNQWSQQNLSEDQDDKPEIIVPKPNTWPVKPLPDSRNLNRDDNNRLIVPDKPKYTPPANNRLWNPTLDTVKPPVNVPNTQIQVPSTKIITETSDEDIEGTAVKTNTTGTIVSPVISQFTGNSSNVNTLLK